MNKNDQKKIIIKTFENWIKTIQAQDFVMMSPNGELDANGVLKEMSQGSEWGNNFIESIIKMSNPSLPGGVSVFAGEKELSGDDIVKEMKADTEFGKDYFASSLEIVFMLIKKGLHSEKWIIIKQ